LRRIYRGCSDHEDRLSEKGGGCARIAESTLERYTEADYAANAEFCPEFRKSRSESLMVQKRIKAE